MSWDNELQQPSWAGVEFESLDVTDEWGLRVQVSEYPYRDGAEIEIMGREPVPTSFAAVIAGPDYLDRLSALKLAFEAQKVATLQHPLLGSWPAVLERVNVRHSSARRDHADLQLSFRESQLDAALPDLFSISGAADAIAIQVTDAEQAVDDAGFELADITTAIGNASSFASDAEAATLGSLVERVNEQRAAVEDARSSLQSIEDASKALVLGSMERMAFRCQQLKDAREALAPQVREHEIEAEMPLTVLSLRLYGTPDRADEIRELNQIRGPFVRPGDVVRVYGS